MKFCSNCGEKINDEGVVCKYCGCSVKSSQNISKENSKKEYVYLKVEDEKKENLQRNIKITITVIGIIVFVIIVFICSRGAHEHQMAEKIIKEATCTEDGEIKYYCKNCDYNYTQKIEAKHDYEETVLEKSTCVVKGKSKFTCRVCGNSYEKENELTSHFYKNKYCTVCGAKKFGKIDVDIPIGELSYGVSSTIVNRVIMKYKINDLKAYIASGKMFVTVSGTETYNADGKEASDYIKFNIVIKDSSYNVVARETVFSDLCRVNESFEINTRMSRYFDDSEDYTVEIEEYWI